MHRQADAEKFKILGPAGSMHAPTQLLINAYSQPATCVPWVVFSDFSIQVTSPLLLSGFHLGCLLSVFLFLFQWLSSGLPLLCFLSFSVALFQAASSLSFSAAYILAVLPFSALTLLLSGFLLGSFLSFPSVPFLVFFFSFSFSISRMYAWLVSTRVH